MQILMGWHLFDSAYESGFDFVNDPHCFNRGKRLHQFNKLRSIHFFSLNQLNLFLSDVKHAYIDVDLVQHCLTLSKFVVFYFALKSGLYYLKLLQFNMLRSFFDRPIQVFVEAHDSAAGVTGNYWYLFHLQVIALQGYQMLDHEVSLLFLHCECRLVLLLPRGALCRDSNSSAWELPSLLIKWLEHDFFAEYSYICKQKTDN